MEEKLLTAQELAYNVGCSVQTIGMYYKFKKENPENEYAMMLPDYVRSGSKNTRYWKESAIEAVKKFREVLPQGRGGALGSVTQRYVNTDAPLANERRAARFDQITENADESKSRAYIDKVETILNSNCVDKKVIEQIKEMLITERESR